MYLLPSLISLKLTTVVISRNGFSLKHCMVNFIKKKFKDKKFPELFLCGKTNTLQGHNIADIICTN